MQECTETQLCPDLIFGWTPPERFSPENRQPARRRLGPGHNL